MRMLSALGPLLLATVVTLALAAADGPDPAGSWRLRVDWPRGAVDVTLDIEAKDDGWVGTWTGPRGSIEGIAVQLDGSELTFALEMQIDRGGSALERESLPFRGTIEGNHLQGVLSFPAGTEVKVEGTRAAS